MGMEDDFLLEDEDDQKTIEFIKNYLPQDLKDKFTEDDLYYILLWNRFVFRIRSISCLLGGGRLMRVI